jgi:hypothetical protein
MKIAYFTENLNLTPGEAERFWPLYNTYEQQKHELHRKRRLRSREFAENAEQMTEEEAEGIIDLHLEARGKELELDQKFHDELKKVLPAKKIMKLYIAEIEFREYMLRKIREDRGGPHRDRVR